MLTHIHIQNYILVKNLTIDFEHGLNILTGETGAGKSLWMDAVMIALGARTDNSIIRHQTKQCSITLSFDISKNIAVQNWLTEHDIAADDTCIIRRCIYKDRATKTTINDQPCTLGTVKTLAPLLLSIHGQHHHQSLLKIEAHRQMLDQFASNEKLLNQIKTIVQQYQQTQKQIDLLKAQSGNQQQQLALYQFHLQELEALNLQPKEWQTIFEQHQQSHHDQAIINNLAEAEQLLQQNDVSIIDLVQKTQTLLQHATNKNKALTPVLQLIDEAHINLSEAATELTNLTSNMEMDPAALASLEERLNSIHQIARKHHIEPEALFDYQQTLQQNIDQLTNMDEHLQTLQTQQQTIVNDYQVIADKLTKSRQKAAKQLQKAITEDMQLLGMEGGIFKIECTKLLNPIHNTGQDQIIFTVSTNPGQPCQPLQEVVSGGELSRISLSLHRHLADKNQQPTLIFDEVDTGIGGKTADKVGALLKDLSQQYQILCITHLPQIASLADQHFKAEKQSTKTETETMMIILNQSQRIEELSRMLGGSKITPAIREHAKQLLNV